MLNDTNKTHNIDWHRAAKWWPEAFNNDYEKYIEAFFPWDEKSQINYLQTSNEWKDYYSQLESRLISENSKWEIFNTIDFINIKVINLLQNINYIIK